MFVLKLRAEAIIAALVLLMLSSGPSFAQMRTTGSTLLDTILNKMFEQNVYSNDMPPTSRTAGFDFCLTWTGDPDRCRHRALGVVREEPISFEEGVCAAGVGDVYADACNVYRFGMFVQYSLGDAICRALTRGDTYQICNNFGRPLTLEQGICRGGVGSRWALICLSTFGFSLGEAICRVGLKDSNWASVCLTRYGEDMTVNEAIEKLPLLVTGDVDWDWDGFYNQGNYVWVCRGIQTGQFADFENCAGDLKIDDRWPG